MSLVVLERVIPMGSISTEARVSVTYVQPVVPPKRIYFRSYDVSPKKFKPGDSVKLSYIVEWYPKLHKEGTLHVVIELHVAGKIVTFYDKKFRMPAGSTSKSDSVTVKVPDLKLSPGEYPGTVVFRASLSW